MTGETQIPLYTKIGMRVTAVLLILFIFLLTKNCVGSFRYGTSTRDESVSSYYSEGYRAGVAKANGEMQPEVTFDNPLLQKSYMKGFRAGYDEVARSGKTRRDRPVQE